MSLHKVHTNCALLASSPFTSRIESVLRKRQLSGIEIRAYLLRALVLMTEMDRA
jgi:hypothetical protein